MQQLRLGIVGCGEVAQVIHLPSLHQCADRFAVTALCDVSAEVMNAVGDQWGIARRYQAYEDLLAQNDIDAVLIANPHAYHAEATLAAIAAGKHVLVEKPMCLTLREADAVIEAQQQGHVTVQVGYMRRYAPAFVEACRMVKELEEIRLARVYDVIGKNELIIDQTSRVVRGSDIPADVIAAGKAMQQALVEEAIGDAPAALQSAYLLMLGLSTHDISAMRELLGRPQRVLYAAQRLQGAYLSAAFDYGNFVCHYETGIDRIPRFHAGIEVFGAERVIHVKYETPYVRNLPVRLYVTEANGSGGVVEQAIQPSWNDPFVAEWHAFYDNITKQQTPKTSPADFRADLELFGEMIHHMQQR